VYQLLLFLHMQPANWPTVMDVGFSYEKV